MLNSVAPALRLSRPTENYLEPLRGARRRQTLDHQQVALCLPEAWQGQSAIAGYSEVKVSVDWYDRASVDRTDQIPDGSFVQTAFWEVCSEPFGSRLSQDASSKRTAPAL